MVTERIVDLGERLFFDPAFSSDRSISCSSCHDPQHAFAGQGRYSTGVAGRIGSRNAPAIVNRLLGRSQFWDGRAVDLLAQVSGPLFAHAEMDMTEELLLRRLRDGGYVPDFEEAFDQVPSLVLFARAISAFESTLLCAGSDFDRFEWNNEEGALDASQKRGLDLFRGKARCTLCHTGTNFTDERFHDVGLSDAGDQGRAAVTGDPEDLYAYKTPTLRNVVRTGPYMHDGRFSSLEEVVAHYDRGGERPDSELVPLDLSDQERSDLVAFLGSLTAPVLSVRVRDLEEKLADSR